MACVYEHRCAATGRSYIGKTNGSARARWVKHLNAAKLGCQYAFARAIRKYGAEAFVMTVHATGLSDAEAALKERELISALGTKTPHGYNRTDGGAGVPGLTFTEDVRARLRASHLGKKDSAETLARKSAAHAHRPPGTDAMSRQNSRVRKDSATGIKGVKLDSRNGRPFAVIKVGGKTHHLGSFDSIDEAGAAYLGAKAQLHPHWRDKQPGAALVLPPIGGKRVRSDSLTGLQGVQPHGSKWVARIKLNGRTKHLGMFPTAEEAHAAFLAAAATRASGARSP